MLHLSQNIKLIRGLMNKTQPEFAKLIDENVSNLKTYERTGILPKVHIRKRIAELAGVSVNDLLGKDLSEKDITLRVDKDDKNETKGPEQAQKSTNENGKQKSTDKLTTATTAPDFQVKHSNGNLKKEVAIDKDAVIQDQAEAAKLHAQAHLNDSETMRFLTQLLKDKGLKK